MENVNYVQNHFMSFGVILNLVEEMYFDYVLRGYMPALKYACYFIIFDDQRPYFYDQRLLVKLSLIFHRGVCIIMLKTPLIAPRENDSFQRCTIILIKIFDMKPSQYFILVIEHWKIFVLSFAPVLKFAFLAHAEGGFPVPF